MMNISYRFAGFTQQSSDVDGKIVFSHDLKQVVEFPDYIEVCVPEKLHQ